MFRYTKIITALYWAALIADIALTLSGMDNLRYISKCLLMPLLIVFLLVSTYKISRPYSKVMLTAALLFSWAGDAFLLTNASVSFIYGLVSFLFAHLAYILFFTRILKNTTSNKKALLIAFLGMGGYAFLLVFFLWKNIDGLRLPIVIYTVVLSLMFLSAFQTRAKQRIGKRIPAYFIAGAALFVLSDSMLAIDKFYIHHQLLKVMVMITYATAQYLIVKGGARYINRYR